MLSTSTEREKLKSLYNLCMYKNKKQNRLNTNIVTLDSHKKTFHNDVHKRRECSRIEAWPGNCMVP